MGCAAEGCAWVAKHTICPTDQRDGTDPSVAAINQGNPLHGQAQARADAWRSCVNQIVHRRCHRLGTRMREWHQAPSGDEAHQPESEQMLIDIPATCATMVRWANPADDAVQISEASQAATLILD